MEDYDVKEIEVNVTLVRSNTEDINTALGEYKTLSDANFIGSYFLSYGWIQAWLTTLPSYCKVFKVLVLNHKEPVAFFFMGLVTVTRGKLFKIRQLVLNASGDIGYDKIWIEYNSIFSAPGFKLDVETILKKIPFHWEEFYLPGLDIHSFPGNRLSTLSSPYKYSVDNSTVSPYVDLEKVRQVCGDYLSLLSGNTRSQIRRSFRILEDVGSVELKAPDDLNEAFLIYRELVGLHQTTWESRGEAGGFSSALFCRFHERLIRNRFDKGEIQLLRVHAGGTTIGCLYSFIWNGCVYFYQCGFNYLFGKKVQPGLVSHLMAVQYNAGLGYDVYDFLAGDDQYKRSLSTDSNEMSWGRIQRVSWKLKLEERLRSFYERFRDNEID